MDILPNVSVLIPTYNRRKFLDLCLDNIMKQSYPKKKCPKNFHIDILLQRPQYKPITKTRGSNRLY